jgi:uncharacterized Zn-finger protein
LQTCFKVHTVEKPHHCTQCSKSFAFISKFKRQLIVKYREKPGKKPYSCFLCTEAFALSDALKEHLRVHF